MVGNTVNYTKLDVKRDLLYIDKNTSRLSLKKKLGLGEGTIRSILNILKQKKFIDSTRKGHSLTSKGRKIIDKLNSLIEIKKFISKNIYPKHKKTALLIKNIKKSNIGYSERDIALKSGAEGAMLFVYKTGRSKKQKPSLVMPQMKGVRFRELEKLFNYKQNNILVITFADNYRDSENSALTVGLSLKKNEVKI